MWHIEHYHKITTSTVTDLEVRRTHDPLPFQFFHFHVVFGKNYANNRLAPLGLVPPFGKTWIRRCSFLLAMTIQTINRTFEIYLKLIFLLKVTITKG